MSSSPAQPKTASCSACQRTFDYVPRFFDGKEVFTPQDCPECAEKERAFREKVVADRAREERRIVWGKLNLPFCTPATATVISKLPSTRSQTVLRWSYGPKGLFCHGGSGLGKTRTVIELLRRLWVEEGREFRFESWPTWQNRLEAAHRYGGTGKYREITPLQQTPILALDDVGKGKVTELVTTAFFSIIDHRSSRGLPTFITTKFSLARVPDSPFEKRLAEGSPDAARDITRRLADSMFNQPFVADITP